LRANAKQVVKRRQPTVTRLQIWIPSLLGVIENLILVIETLLRGLLGVVDGLAGSGSLRGSGIAGCVRAEYSLTN
jgi:hypothetical protein